VRITQAQEAESQLIGPEDETNDHPPEDKKRNCGLKGGDAHFPGRTALGGKLEEVGG